MALHNFQDLLQNGSLESSGAALYVPAKGCLIGWGTALPTTTVWAKGAVFIKIDGEADANLYINEAGDGEGTSPSWVAIST